MPTRHRLIPLHCGATRRARATGLTARVLAVVTVLAACASAGGGHTASPGGPAARFRGSYAGSGVLARTVVAPAPEAPETSTSEGDGIEVAGDTSVALHVTVISHGERCALRAAEGSAGLVIAPDQVCAMHDSRATMRITGGDVALDGTALTLRLHGQVTEDTGERPRVTTFEYRFEGTPRETQAVATP